MPAPFSYKNDSDEDQRANPQDTARNLQEQEQQSAYDRDFNRLTDPEHLSKDGESGDIGDTTREAEEKGGWKSNYAGNRSKSGQGISKANFTAVLKKRGPLAAILTLVFGGGIGASIFFGPSLLLIQLQEQFITKFNSQDTSMTIRANKIINSKILGDTTSGSCEYVKIACRFSKPSNKLLLNLEKSGIVALDANEKPITKTGLFQNDRPAKYKFKNETIDAKTFAARLNTDPEFRAAFHRAYNPRIVGFADSVFDSVAKKFGFDKKSRFSAEDDAKAIQDKLNDSTKGADDAARTAVSEGTEEATEGVISKLIKERGAKILKTLSKAGKGGATTLTAGVACAATNIPSAVIAVSRAYQMRQVISYGMAFLTTASAMKASAPDLTGETVSTLGSTLTETVDGKSAMDSFGVKNALYGDTSSENDDFKKYAPGVLAVGALSGLAGTLGNQSIKSGCDVALNPVTGAALNATLVAAGGATFGTTALLAGINLSVGLLLEAVITNATPVILSLSMPLITPLIQNSAGAILGDITADISGVDVGNAYASGAGHVMGQTANAGGNVPLSVDQAVAYNNTSQEVQLAYAEEDRVTLSPLDATNENTFVGNIVSNFLPYYAQLGSLTGTLHTIINIPMLSLSTISTSANAADSAAQYSLCDDPAIKDADIAAGPFCNIEYGIPPEYLDMDPLDVVNELIASGDIDEYSGKPKTSGSGDTSTGYEDWKNLCLDGTTDQAAICKIDPVADPEGARKVSLYAIYTIDHRIQKTMDGQDDDQSTQGTGAGIVLPVPDDYSVTTEYGAGTYGGGDTSFHRGIDFVSSTNEVRAFRDGTVVNVGDSQGNNTVAIQHSDGLISWYLHMYKEDILVKAGDVVTAGQKIGTAGNSGQSYGTHLHFALNITALNNPSAYSDYEYDPQGRFISPREYFIKNGVAGFE